MTTEVYRAVVGDFYWLWVNDHGQEFFRGRDVASGLRRGVGVLEVTVEAIEADGTVVETTWIKNPKERQCPFRNPGEGWHLVRDDEAKNSSFYHPRRQHEVRIMSNPQKKTVALPDGLESYYERIGAQPIHWTKAVIREEKGLYYNEKVIITIGKDGTVNCPD